MQVKDWNAIQKTAVWDKLSKWGARQCLKIQVNYSKSSACF